MTESFTGSPTLASAALPADPASIRRVEVRSPGEIVVTTADRPVPAADEALVRMVVSGVCGSDTHAAHGRHPFVPLPYFPGHEVVGVVTEVGDDVESVTPGARVTVEPTLPCWTCKMCRTDRSNLCENLRFFGCGYDQGGMADYFTVPANRLHLIPDDLDDEQAALIEPLATPVHAVRLSGDLTGKAVVIIGAGTIGLLVLAAARHAGARRIVVTDILASKRDRAARLGADAVIDGALDDAGAEVVAAGTGAGVVAAVRAELGESADVVFDCVAVQPTVDQATQLAMKGGTVVIVGVPATPVSVPLPQIQDLQMRIQGSATYLPQDYATAIEILLAGLVTTRDMVTSRFPLERVAEAFAASSGGEEVKVLLTRE